MKVFKLSVAAVSALAFSSAALADVPTVYGSILHEVGSYYNANQDKNVISNRSWGSKIGVKGTKDLGDGLTALYQMELGINAVKDDAATGAVDGQTGGGNGNNQIASRNTFVGVTGGFGTVVVGNHDTPYKLASRGAGLVAHSDGVDSITMTERRVKGAVAYIAPADMIGGATLAVAYVPVEDKGTPADDKRDNNGQHLSVGVVVPVADAKIAAGYESVYAPSVDKTVDNIMVGATYKVDMLKVGAAYEQQTINNKAVYARFQVPVTVSFGEGMFVNATYQMTKFDKKGTKYVKTALNGGDESDKTATVIAASVGKKFAKDAEVYVGVKNMSKDKAGELGSTGLALYKKGKASSTDFGVGLRVNF